MKIAVIGTGFRRTGSDQPPQVGFREDLAPNVGRLGDARRQVAVIQPPLAPIRFSQTEVSVRTRGNAPYAARDVSQCRPSDRFDRP